MASASTNEFRSMMDETDVETSLHEMEKKFSIQMPETPTHQQIRQSIDGGDRRPSSTGLVSRYFGSYEKHSRTGIKSANKSPLSKWSWFFLCLAFLQALIIISIQIAIAVLGEFQIGQLEQYVECGNFNLSENSTYPSFGEDKQIYVYIFVFLILYNFLLCVYAMFAQRIVEVFAFVVINIFTVAYAALQVYQFRGFGGSCPVITTVGWLALINVAVVALLNVVFVFLTVQIYVEFGWKVYKFVNCNPALRYYYRMYEIFLSLVKMVIIFNITFIVGQLALILRTDDPEYWLTFPYVIAMICLFFYAYFMVRRESHIAMLVMFFIGILLICYYIFKIGRFATRSCPVCREIVAEIERQRMEEGQVVDNDRREDFQHLIMMASLNMIIVIAYLICVVKVWRQYGKGLADHFYIHGHWFDRIGKTKPSENAYLNSLGTGALAKGSSPKRRKKTSLTAEDRNSSINEAECDRGVEFTPSQELKIDFSMPIPRTNSLPPILEGKQH